MAEAGSALGRVLVVEDDALIATDIAFMLRRAGIAIVGPARDAEVARSLIARGGIDAAVVDINLGEACCFETARRLEERGVPFIFLTGHSRRIIDPAFAAREVLAKPFRERDLLRMVRGLLEHTAPGS